MSLPPFSKKTYQRPFDFLIKDKNLVGAEVGIWRGYHAFLMFQVMDIKKLSLIDPWVDYSGYKGEDSFEYTKKFLKDYSDRINLIRKTSEEASKLFEDESLDFVYIDGNHTYEHVIRDINLWAPKVKSGGIVAGHDYDGAFSGTVKAVNEYCNKNKIEFEVRGKKNFSYYDCFADWAFKKDGLIKEWNYEVDK